MSPAPPAALAVARPRPPCASLRSGGGQTWRRVRGFWLAGWLVVGHAEGVTCPPRLRRCPRTGALVTFWTSRFALGTLMNLTADLEVPWRKTPTFKKPRDRPTLGGSAAGAGGMSSRSAKPTTRSPPNLGGSAERSEEAGGLVPHSAKPTRRAKHQPRTQRQVCPPPETAGRDTGVVGRGATESEGRGGCGGRVIPSAKPPLHAKLQPLDTACWRPEGEAGIGASISTRD